MKSAESSLNEGTDSEREPSTRVRDGCREEPEKEEEKPLSRSSLPVVRGEDKRREDGETFKREISSSLSPSTSLPQRSSITERCPDRRNDPSSAAAKGKKNPMEEKEEREAQEVSSVEDRMEEKKRKKVALVHVHQYTVEDGYSTQPVVLNKHVSKTMR